MVTQVAIVILNSLTRKPNKTKTNLRGGTHTSRNNISYVNHDVISSFKVKREGNANGDSWNEFNT